MTLLGVPYLGIFLVNRISMEPPPQIIRRIASSALENRGTVQKPATPESLNLEAWSSGYLNGALVIMACITVANMRKGVLLHKVIFPSISYLSKKD